MAAKMLEWENAWAEYVEALNAFDADWTGENFVQDIGRVGRRLADAKRHLRTVDAEFCTRLGI